MGKTVRLNPKVTPKYKYNINHQIGLLPHKNNLIQQIIDHLATYGVSRNEFYGDREIPYGSAKSIPDDRLKIYEQLFECDRNDLTNQPSLKVKSIRDLLDPRPRSFKHGLKSKAK